MTKTQRLLFVIALLAGLTDAILIVNVADRLGYINVHKEK